MRRFFAGAVIAALSVMLTTPSAGLAARDLRRGDVSDKTGHHAHNDNSPDDPNGRGIHGLSSRPDRQPLGGASGLIWEDRFDGSDFEQTFMAATARGRVFAAGYVAGATGRDFLIRAYDGRTGNLVWHDQVDKGSDDFASGVATDGRRVFVSGTYFVPGHGYDWILRAYDADEGAFLWETTFDLSGGDDFSRGTALVAAAGQVYLGGFGDTGDGYLDWIIRAFDASTGALAWQDRRDVADRDDGVYTMTADGSRLFAGGWGGTPAADQAFVRAYDLRSGALLWERSTPGAPGFSQTWTRKVDVEGGRVFAGLMRRDPSSLAYAPVVQVYSAATGASIWSQEFDTGGEADWLGDLDAESGRVVVVGNGGPDCLVDTSPPSNCESVVRSYDAANGRLNWERQQTLSPLDDEGGLVTIHGGKVFVWSGVATTYSVPFCCVMGYWSVQSFDSGDGELLWQSVGGKYESAVYNMVVDRGILFIPGRAIDAVTEAWDWLLRAYDVTGRRGIIDSLPFIPLPLVTGTGTSGQVSFELSTDQALTTQAHGLSPADEQPGNVVDDPANDFFTAYSSGEGVTSHAVTVPAGTRLLSVRLFDEETDGADDLDLFVFDSSGNFVGASGGATAAERVEVTAPAADDYTVVVHGYETDGPDANYTLFAWAVPEANLGNFTVSGPPPAGGTVTVTWSGLMPGLRYLGVISYFAAGIEVGHTLVSIRT